MEWTATHGRLLARAFEHLLGLPEVGTIAFTRCLDAVVVAHLAEDDQFAPVGWSAHRVAGNTNSKRTITADMAVEWREEKSAAKLLLVDTEEAGAGMDGIYSASREVDEAELFAVACRLAAAELTRQTSRKNREYAEQAVKVARRAGSRHGVSPWAEFDFLVQLAERQDHPGRHLHRLGLWPIRESDEPHPAADLATSRKLVDRLLGVGATGLSIPARIDSLQLEGLDDKGRTDLERFLHEADALPLLLAMAKLAEQEHLWVGVIQVLSAEIQALDLLPWRLTNGKVAKWSGLVERDVDSVPQFILNPDAKAAAAYSTLEVRWKPRPSGIAKGTVDYRVAILTNNMEEELAVRELSHSDRTGGEKCRFNNDDFEHLDEQSLVSAKAVVSVIDNEKIDHLESEEFQIRYGHPPEKDVAGAGKKVRAFSEGLIELGSRESISAVLTDPSTFSFDDKKNSALLRTKDTQRLSFQVPCPPLIRELEKQWIGAAGAPGRWRVKVREIGTQASNVEFLEFGPTAGGEESAWNRVRTASRRLAERFGRSGSIVGHVHDDRSRTFGRVRDYILAWAAILEAGGPTLSLNNTVEVQSLSGSTIGLIVLPMHPLRLAWHAAYDNLVLHAACEEQQKPKDILDDLRCLDGAMFPAFLPNPAGGVFVFADTLGFHAVGMVPDADREPKAATAILARALGDGKTTENAPTVGGQSAKLVGEEIIKYLDCHDAAHLLHVHAIRAGDGLTLAKSLGHVYGHFRVPEDADDGLESEDAKRSVPAFSLEMYPSQGQRGIAGRYIAAARERRRSGAGVVAADDHWMLESLSLPGGVTMPRLRWAKKDREEPVTAAHVAVAFDTFESNVRVDDRLKQPQSPFRAFGLLSFYEREFIAKPTPAWRSTIPAATEGEKHPSERGHTERLERLQRAMQAAVAKHVVGNSPGRNGPTLHTGVPPEKEDNLKKLHALCDWVVTLDRNAGIEYFDSPRDNQAIYDAYVIDCVPEREDLGCLQLITSTSNLDEVRTLLDSALDRMGLSRSLRNTQFLLAHLKALSGRLAIRLTGNKPPTSELIALAVSHANCRQASNTDSCWLSLADGFIVPADDVRELVPPLKEAGNEKQVRPDLIYITAAPRKGLQFRFVEIKYRRDLRAARSPDLLRTIRNQTDGMRKRWAKWYSHEECSAFRAIRRAKLSRVLRFYADKARRHYLSADRHAELSAEIDRMLERGRDYVIGADDPSDLGWVFCPEYGGREPSKISPDDWSSPEVFLFGPSLFPDSDVDDDIPIPSSSVDVDASPPGDSGSPSTDSQPSQNFTPPEPHSESTTKRDRGEDAPSILLGTDATSNVDVRWPLTIKGNPHLLIAGLPGMGKTTCLLNLCTQMIDVGITPIIFSYHADIDERLGNTVDSVRFIDFNGLGFDPLHVVDRENHMAYLDVAGAMRDIFTAIYPDLGDIQADRIRKAIRDSFAEAGWANVGAADDLQEPAFGRFVEILRNEPRPNQSLRALLARLDELDDYGFFQIDQLHGSLWDGEQPTVVRIHTTQNDNLQRAFASLVFYGLYKDMFRRGIQDRIAHALVFDEAHRAAGLKLIPTMAKECRKYGISLVLASQEARDFHVSVFSAIANYLVLRLTETDAKALVRNVSDSRQERALVDRIKQMDRFKALYFREGTSRASRVNLAP